jgi:hypothetical protein
MIDFICNEKNCPNEGIQYNFLGNPKTADCGGCKNVLIGTNERPDPEPIPVFLDLQKQD